MTSRFVGVVVAAVYTFMLLPVALVIWLSFSRSSVLQFPPSGYSTKWYYALKDQPQLTSGLVYSLEIAAVACVISLLLGIAGALASSHSGGRFAGIVDSFFTGPVIVPAIVTGVALYIYLYELSYLFRVGLVPSTWTLVVAHVIITLPWTYRLTAAGLASLPDNVERAALDLGARRRNAVLQVTLPLVRSSVIGAGIIAFIWSFANLEVSLFLVAPGRGTLPIAMVEYAHWHIDPTLAAMATVQIVVVGALMAVATRLLRIEGAFSGVGR